LVQAAHLILSKEKITGLDTAKYYNIDFYGGSSSSLFADNGTTVYIVNNLQRPLYVQNNTNNNVCVTGIKPAIDGSISFTMIKKNASTPAGYLNAMVITELYSDNTLPKAPINLTAQTLRTKKCFYSGPI